LLESICKERTPTRFRDQNPSGEKSAQIGTVPHLPHTELILSYLDVRSSKEASQLTQENNISSVQEWSEKRTRTWTRLRDRNPSGEKSAQIGTVPHLPCTEQILSYLDVTSSKEASQLTQENNVSSVQEWSEKRTRTWTWLRDWNPSGEKSEQIGTVPHLPRTEQILSYLDVTSSKEASQLTQENNVSSVQEWSEK
jgi:phosphohistidine phosphatase SixA